jgi:hypothetical protein
MSAKKIKKARQIARAFENRFDDAFQNQRPPRLLYLELHL